jgi:hypothetical protein
MQTAASDACCSKFPKKRLTIRVDNPKKVYGNIGGISGQNEMIYKSRAMSAAPGT